MSCILRFAFVAFTTLASPSPSPSSFRGAELAPTSTFSVLLDKQHVPVQVKGRPVAHKTAYFGNISVGYPQPQNFTVVFDTGSAHFFLPDSTCKREACLNHQRYSRDLSGSAIEINHDGIAVHSSYHERDLVSISYGTGEVVGDFVDEIVCLKPAGVEGPASLKEHKDPHERVSCARVRLICARELSAEPFSAFHFDGVLGLGLDALALHPDFNFFGQMARGGLVAPIFGFFLAVDDSAASEITFGGHNAKHTTGPLQWVPVASPERGYWQIKVEGVRIGNSDVDICDEGDCVAIVDTGTSLLGVPRSSAQAIHMKLARRVPAELSSEEVDCRTVDGPELTFDVGDFDIKLEASDYSRPATMSVKAEASGEEQVICRASMLPVDMPVLGPKVFLWGEPVLRKYYTAYDAQRRLIGFAPAVQQTIPTAPKRWDVVV